MKKHWFAFEEALVCIWAVRSSSEIGAQMFRVFERNIHAQSASYSLQCLKLFFLASWLWSMRLYLLFCCLCRWPNPEIWKTTFGVKSTNSAFLEMKPDHYIAIRIFSDDLGSLTDEAWTVELERLELEEGSDWSRSRIWTTNVEMKVGTVNCIRDRDYIQPYDLVSLDGS